VKRQTFEKTGLAHSDAYWWTLAERHVRTRWRNPVQHRPEEDDGAPSIPSGRPIQTVRGNLLWSVGQAHMNTVAPGPWDALMRVLQEAAW